ncbi:hypothetical protein E3N88_07565 [Mikania micrantha]|uniref:AP complex mu/sigma subunit domain-containing protein n=1 Tax=Mikania micrantha TaxID=192012 RepID=A0A5N6PUS6_9ASTR|nr:hypothetical protein E3N88_07565 [Mikania micrantha]
MIRFILLQNRQGKTRLAKYYIPLEESEKHKVEYEVHRLVVNRDPKFTNFVEVPKQLRWEPIVPLPTLLLHCTGVQPVPFPSFESRLSKGFGLRVAAIAAEAVVGKLQEVSGATVEKRIFNL